jgi:hypothetical protein
MNTRHTTDTTGYCRLANIGLLFGMSTELKKYIMNRLGSESDMKISLVFRQSIWLRGLKSGQIFYDYAARAIKNCQDFLMGYYLRRYSAENFSLILFQKLDLVSPELSKLYEEKAQELLEKEGNKLKSADDRKASVAIAA